MLDVSGVAREIANSLTTGGEYDPIFQIELAARKAKNANRKGKGVRRTVALRRCAQEVAARSYSRAGGGAESRNAGVAAGAAWCHSFANGASATSATAATARVVVII